METHPLTARNWLVVALIAVVAGIWFVAPYLGVIALYGLLGVVYGPIIMIIIVTSIQMYLDYYQELPRWKRKANKAAK